MRTIVTAAVTGAGFATAGLGFALAVGVRPVHSVVDGYVLALGAVGLLAGFRATRRAHRGSGASALERALTRTPPEPERPSGLVRLEREVDLALANAFYLHYRLRPLAREIASNRLRTLRGVELDGEAGREVFGEELWELLRPDRPPPSDPHGPGLPLDRLRQLVERLERI